jgi:cystathionine beta-lyase/cystathionine gamma-synthase
MDTNPDQAESPARFETLCIHAFEDASLFHGAVAPPIYQNSLFAFPSYEDWRSGEPHYSYTRAQNPTTEVLERKMAVLEGGEAARAFASGMGAIMAAVTSCVKAGGHVVTVENCYGRALFDRILGRFGVEYTIVPGTEVSQFEEATRPNTMLYYLESPCSMTFRVQDIAEVSGLAKTKGIATIVDNTYCTPYFQNPLSLGAELVMHSASKYLGGHSDVVAGVAVGSEERVKALTASEGVLMGASLDPFAAWLVVRGLRTLPVRLKQHQRNAGIVARWLEEHPAVEEVYYPGLASHPQVEIIGKQMRGSSGLLSFTLRQTEDARVIEAVNKLRYFRLGCSWGGFESLAVPMRTQEIGPGHSRWMWRLHVGIEHIDDLMSDLDSSLSAL